MTPLQREQHSVQLVVSGRYPEILNTFSKITILEGEVVVICHLARKLSIVCLKELELNCAARGSPRPTLQWSLKERPVLSKYLVDVVNADQAEFITKTSGSWMEIGGSKIPVLRTVGLAIFIVTGKSND